MHKIWVEQCSPHEVQTFIEAQHYSHSVFGVTTRFAFRVLSDGLLVGAALFGLPAGKGVLEKYSDNGTVPTLELRRFCLVDALPKNSESRVLAVMFRQLRKEGLRRVLSYADPKAGHSGTIYKATGFRAVGRTSSRRKLLWRGREYPDRNLHQTHYPYHAELRKAVASGEAKSIRIPGKLVFVKDL